MDFSPNQSHYTQSEIIFGFPQHLYSMPSDTPENIFTDAIKTLTSQTSPITGSNFIVPPVPESFQYALQVSAVLWFIALSTSNSSYFIPGKIAQYGNLPGGANAVRVNGAPLPPAFSKKYDTMYLGDRIDSVAIPSIEIRGGIDLSNLQTTLAFTPDITAPDFAPVLALNVRVILKK